MKKLKLVAVVILAIFCLNTMQAQTNDLAGNEAPIVELNTTNVNMFKYYERWIFGFGVNIVHDDISGTNSEKGYNFNTPLVLSAEYLLNNSFSFNGTMSFNKYVAGKSVDNRYVLAGKDATYVAFDLNTKYHFLNLDNDYLFEPYLMGGLGYTHIGGYRALKNNSTEVVDIPAAGRVTMNMGVGVNYWFSEAWGMNANLMGKFGIESTDYVSNQTQFSVSILYSPRF